MSTFVKLGDEIWRDYETDGVPASGSHDPKKAEIRQWATTVESRLGVVEGAAENQMFLAIGDSRMSGEEPKTTGDGTLEPVPTDQNILDRAKNWNDAANAFQEMALNGDGTDSPVARTAWEIATQGDTAYAVDNSHSGSIVSDFLPSGSYYEEVFNPTTGHTARAVAALGVTHIDAVIVSLVANNNPQSFTVNEVVDDILSLMAEFRSASWFGPRTKVYWIETMPYSDGTSGKNIAVHLAAELDPSIQVVSAFGQLGDFTETPYPDPVHETSISQVLMGKKFARAMMSDATSPRFSTALQVDDTCIFEIGIGTSYWTRINDFCNFAKRMQIGTHGRVYVKIAPGVYQQNTIRFGHPQGQRFKFYAEGYESLTMPSNAQLATTDRAALETILDGIFTVKIEFNDAGSANGIILEGLGPMGTWAGILFKFEAVTNSLPAIRCGITDEQFLGGAQIALPRSMILGGANNGTSGVGISAESNSLVDIQSTFFSHMTTGVSVTYSRVIAGDAGTIKHIDPQTGTQTVETALATFANINEKLASVNFGSQAEFRTTKFINDPGSGIAWQATRGSQIAINGSDVTLTARTSEAQGGAIYGKT